MAVRKYDVHLYEIIHRLIIYLMLTYARTYNETP